MISYRHPRSQVGLLLLWVPLLALQLGGDVPAWMDVVRVAGITFFLVVALLAARERVRFSAYGVQTRGWRTRTWDWSAVTQLRQRDHDLVVQLDGRRRALALNRAWVWDDGATGEVRDRVDAIPRVEALWAAHRTSQPMSAEQRSAALGG